MKKNIKLFLTLCLLMVAVAETYAQSVRECMVIVMLNQDSIAIPRADNPTLLVDGDQLSLSADNYGLTILNKNNVAKIIYDKVGISDAVRNINADISAYPTVTDDFVVISGISSESVIDLYGVNGVHYGAKLQRSSTSARLDIRSLPTGAYVLTIDNQTIKLYKK